MKIAIIGKGHVGQAIGNGLAMRGHEVKFGHRDPKEPVLEAANWGEVIVLAVPYAQLKETAKELGAAADGKVVIDVTNAIAEDGGLAIGFSTSAAEELQNRLSKSFVAKAFNTVFAKNQSTGKIGKEQLTLFVAADDKKAKQTVMRLGEDLGFETIDAGPLKTARYLEPMGMFIISLAFNLGVGTSIGFKLVKG